MLFDDVTECQEAIANALIESVDEAWEQIRLEADLDGEGVDLLVLYRPRGSREFSGEVSDVEELGQYLFELAEWVSTPEQGLLKKCVFTVDYDGRYKADFSYQGSSG